MKKLSLGLIALVLCLAVLFTGCGKTDGEKNNSASENTTQAEKIPTAEELAKDFTLDAESEYSKKLENAWLMNPKDIEINAMYRYRNAKFYQSIDRVSMAENEMKNISPDYKGVMKDDIVGYGLALFNTKEAWEELYKEKQEHLKLVTNEKRTEIKDWISERYNYYDEQEGRYCDDEFTETIFNEAAEKFGLTFEEINNIWSDLPL